MTVIYPLDYEVKQNDFPADTTPVYDSGKMYLAIGTKVQYKGHIYKNAKDTDAHKSPDSDPDKWVNMGVVNEEAFADVYVNSQSVGEGTIMLKINPHADFDHISLLNMVCEHCKIYDAQGDLIFEQNGMIKRVRTWWEYYYKPFEGVPDMVCQLDTPISGEITIELISSASATYTKLGMLVIGLGEFLGVTNSQGSIGAINYSKKITNEWGDTRVIEGRKTKYFELTGTFPKEESNYYEPKFRKYLSKPCVFQGDEGKDEGALSVLTVYGLLKDYEIELSTFDRFSWQMSIEGLV